MRRGAAVRVRSANFQKVPPHLHLNLHPCHSGRFCEHGSCSNAGGSHRTGVTRERSGQLCQQVYWSDAWTSAQFTMEGLTSHRCARSFLLTVVCERWSCRAVVRLPAVCTYSKPATVPPGDWRADGNVPLSFFVEQICISKFAKHRDPSRSPRRHQQQRSLLPTGCRSSPA